MKKGVISLLVIFSLLLNINYVNGLGTVVDSRCDGNNLYYTLYGGGESGPIDCTQIMTNYNLRRDTVFCQNDGLIAVYGCYDEDDPDTWHYQRCYDPDFSIGYREDYRDYNPCNKCGVYYEDDENWLASCIGYRIGEERAVESIRNYPDVGECEGATETYMGMQYVIDLGFDLINNRGLLWDQSYNWSAETEEVCNNNRDDDCDGDIDENDDCGIGCVPEDVENSDCESGNRNCPTGTITRVCQYNGAWGNWGNCMVDVEECIDCAGEGQIPDEGEECCLGKPLDDYTVGSGRCGCPTNLRWDLDSESCIPTFQTCGLSNDVQVCNSLIDILTHPLDCLRRLSGDRNPPPYEQACCPYIEYEGEEYYKFMDIEVY